MTIRDLFELAYIEGETMRNFYGWCGALEMLHAIKPVSEKLQESPKSLKSYFEEVAVTVNAMPDAERYERQSSLRELLKNRIAETK